MRAGEILKRFIDGANRPYTFRLGYDKNGKLAPFLHPEESRKGGALRVASWAEVYKRYQYETPA